ncbi:MAG: hypothetical protein P1U86_10815 [Verrucomicrobiales bacterium]|nr:hypothetical protein [Verrucomicrobiales bacterium]
MSEAEANLHAAEKVAAILEEFQVEAIVIGAIALAAHRYIRYTEDIDLGVNTDLATLRKITDALRVGGFQTELREPDGADPFSGVIDVTGEFGLVQIVNFGQTFPAVISDALKVANLTVKPGSRLRLAPLAHLIVLKLYAGGLKSKADVAELLTRNPDADIDRIRELCKSYRIRGLDEIIDEISR